MARRSSKRSGSTGNKAETTSAEAETDRMDTATDQPDQGESLAPDVPEPPADETVSDADTVAIERAATDGNAGDDSLTGAAEDDETAASDHVEGGAGDDTLEVEASTEPNDEAVLEDVDTVTDPEPAPAPPPQTIVERRGPGFVPLLLGGVVAAGVGYGAAYMGALPQSQGTTDQSEAVATALESQSETLSALQAQVTELANAEPEMPEIPEVDLTPVLEEIGVLSGRLDETGASITAITERVGLLEDRPVFSGNVEEDIAAAAQAVEEIEAELRAQQEAAAAEAAALEAAAADAQAEAAAATEAAGAAQAEAEAAIAAAEAEAEAGLARAAAATALSDVRTALETGAPFPEALTALSQAVEVPEALQAVAETGAPTLDALQDSFAPAAREALPIALRETAGEGTADRLTAFVLGQVGGRSVEPREGDDPDAVLSRVAPAVAEGNLPAALEEIAALPEGAQAVFADWVASVETRAAVDAALEDVAAALDGAN